MRETQKSEKPGCWSNRSGCVGSAANATFCKVGETKVTPVGPPVSRKLLAIPGESVQRSAFGVRGAQTTNGRKFDARGMNSKLSFRFVSIRGSGLFSCGAGRMVTRFPDVPRGTSRKALTIIGVVSDISIAYQGAPCVEDRESAIAEVGRLVASQLHE